MGRDNIRCYTGSYREEYVAKLKERLSNRSVGWATTYALVAYRRENP